MKGGTGEFGFNVSCRVAQAKKEFDKIPDATIDAITQADRHIAKHRRELEDQRVKEDAFFAEQASRPAKRKAEEQRLLQERLLDIAYDAHAATSAERQRVNLLVKQYNGDHYMNPDVHIVKLLELRAILK